MSLLWKLLRRHISPAQLGGFFVANLLGMLIVMLAAQIYVDIRTLNETDDVLMREDYLILHKPVGTLSAITGKAPSFSEQEIANLEEQDFAEKVGRFTTSAFDVTARFDMPSFGSFGTDMFFEAVPDEFIDVETDEWAFNPDSAFIPIILPKSYLDLYNFGFAQSRRMPRLSEGLLEAISLKVLLRGNAHNDWFEERIVGFSTRLQTILVPQTFMDYANEHYGSLNRIGQSTRPSQIIVQLNNPADKRIAPYLQEHGYETDADKLNASKTNYMLRLIVVVVIVVGLLISLLSFYILMLSIYLLVQKNSEKLQNLLLAGYGIGQVARPYQTLTWALNIGVALLAAIILLVLRSGYLTYLRSAFPDIPFPLPTTAFLVGGVLAILVSVLNAIAIRNKIRHLWRN